MEKKNDKLKSIELVFENCDSATIPADYIDSYFFEDITTTHYYRSGNIESDLICGSVFIIFNEKIYDLTYIDILGVDSSVFDRLENKDITQIIVNLQGKEEPYLHLIVGWNDQDAFFNEEQKMVLYDNRVELGINCLDIRADEDFRNTKEYSHNVPNYVYSALRTIEDRLCTYMWNKNNEVYESPFKNTGQRFHGNTFDAFAYDWSESATEDYNFKWRDYEVSWYKYLGRGMRANREISPDECAVMLDEILNTLK